MSAYNTSSMPHHEQFEKHDHLGNPKTCRVCLSVYSHDHNPSHFRICNSCGYKILIVLLVIMIAISYVAWFGVF